MLLRALGAASGTRAERAGKLIPVEGAAGTRQRCVIRRRQAPRHGEVVRIHEIAPRKGGARIVAPRAKVSTTRITEPQQRHTKPLVGVVGGATSGSTAIADGSAGGGTVSSSRARARLCRRPALASSP